MPLGFSTRRQPGGIPGAEPEGGSSDLDHRLPSSTRIVSRPGIVRDRLRRIREARESLHLEGEEFRDVDDGRALVLFRRSGLGKALVGCSMVSTR